MSAGAPLALAGVGFSFPGRSVLADVDLEVRAGEILFVLGRNGSGKSTLLRVAAGLLAPDRGQVSLGGNTMHGMARRRIAQSLAYVPQSAPLEFPFSAFEVVLQGRHPFLQLLARESAHDEALARSALEELQIAELAERSVLELSGGERALVMIAAALAQTPSVLLMDEPAAALDPAHVRQLHDCLRRRVRDGLAVMISAHDLNQAARFADRICALAHGRFLEAAPFDQMITPPRLHEIYGVDFHVGSQAQIDRPYVLLG